MTRQQFLDQIQALADAFVRQHPMDDEAVAELEDLKAQLDALKHEGCRSIIAKDIEKKQGLAVMRAQNAARDELNAIYHEPAFRKMFGIRVRRVATGQFAPETVA